MNLHHQDSVGEFTPGTRVVGPVNLKIYKKYRKTDMERLFRVIVNTLLFEETRDKDDISRREIEGRFCVYGHIDNRFPNYLIITRDLPTHVAGVRPFMVCWGVNNALQFSDVP
jgi:argonaute-like protein implicated in RNA metabolism and viral defense